MSLSNPMYGLIDRLFREAAEDRTKKGIADTGQAPALECHVALKASPTVHYGAMSRTPEGLFRILTAGDVADISARGGSRRALFETFFDADDILSITVERPVSAAPATSSIITAS